MANSDNIRSVTTRHGVFKIFSDDKWVGRSLDLLGEYSEDELSMIGMLLSILRLAPSPAASASGGLTLVEAGAYIGDLTVPLSRLVDRLYAFEPQPDVRALLEENLRVNGCNNVTVMPYALADKDGVLRFSSAQDPDSLGSKILSDEGDVEVECRRLDSLGLVPDFIKADVEGCEVPLLYGAESTIRRCRPLLFMERDTVTNTDLVSLPEALDLLGYHQYQMSFPLYRPNNFRGAGGNPFGMTASFMTLGVPKP